MKQKIENERKISETKSVNPKSDSLEKERERRHKLQEVSEVRENHIDSVNTKEIRDYYETQVNRFNTQMKQKHSLEDTTNQSSLKKKPIT